MDSHVRALIVVSENDRAGLGLQFVRQMTDIDADSGVAVVDVNSFLDTYAEVLKDIVNKDELRILVKRQRHDQLVRIIEAQQQGLSKQIDVEVLEGTPFIEIIKQALRGDHGLIVKMAQSDVSPRERLFGSTDMHLMRKAPVPVLILNPAQDHAPKHILAPVDIDHPDGDEFNQNIVEMAAFVAQQFNSSLRLLHVWRLEGEDSMRHSPFLKIDEQRIEKMLIEKEATAERRLRALADRVRKRFSLPSEPSVHIQKGNANLVIPQFAKDHDIELIAMGTVGRTGIPGLFIGNTAEAVLNSVDCSVLTTKPAGFLTPVAYS